MRTFKITALIASLALLGASTTAMAHDHDHDHGWSYEHPERWGDLEVNKLCSVGEEQSPIDVSRVKRYQETDERAVKVIESYKAQNFSVKNNGHSIVFDVTDKKQSSVYVNGERFELLQFHYHIPSEHTVMSTHYPLELHFVHQNPESKQLAVVGVLVNVGKYNASFNQLVKSLPTKDKDGELLGFNVGTLMPSDGTTFAYNGSLTTPPCSEQVQWLLKETPIDVEPSQIDAFAKFYDSNNRPTRPQSGRDVQMIESK